MPTLHLRRIGALVLAACVTSSFGIVVLRSAWVHDDAYITFRTVDNFVSGLGLRWNVAERVQVYTHPLWMLLVSGLYTLTHELFFTVIFTSVALSLVVVFLVLFGTAASLGGGLVAVAILTLSKAFVDYSTSGLENPLTHAILALFLVVFIGYRDRRWTPWLLSTLAALAAVNRLDTLLLFVPALLSVLWSKRTWRTAAAMSAGLLPLVAWEVFAIVYYGFPFPNTAYAKVIGTGVSEATLVAHGVFYFVNSARIDPITLLAIATGIAVGLFAAEVRERAVVAGIVLYLAYIVYVGGDFVSGRFLTAPLLASVCLLSRWQVIARKPLVAGIVAIAIGFSAPDPPPLNMAADRFPGKRLMDAHGIADERPFYYTYAGFVRAIHGVTVADHPWAVEGRQARRDAQPVAIRGDVGYFGFYAGPRVHVVDVWGLGDPLVARLPTRTDVPWRPGHFTRRIPDGYVETLMSGSNTIADPDVARLYDDIAVVTRGALWTANRWRAIWRLNAHGR